MWHKIHRGVNKMAKAGKKPRAWDTKIQPRLELIKQWTSQGYNEKQVYTKLRVSHGTFYKCKAEHLELQEALKKGLEDVLDEIEYKSVYQLALGGIKTTKVKKTLINGVLTVTEEVTEETLPYFPAAKWALANRRPGKWADKVIDDADTSIETKEDMKSYEA